jgi:Tfp pilus assembly protein PilN
MLEPKKIQGIEIIQQAGEVNYHLVVLEIVKGQMNVQDDYQYINSWEALTELLDNKLPIAIALNVRGLLHRKVELNITNKRLAESVLPNANSQDFYAQGIDIYQGKIASVIRKEQLTQSLQPFLDAKYWVLDVRLGSFDIVQLLPFLRTEDKIITSAHELTIENKQLTGFQKNKNKSTSDSSTILLGDEHISAILLPAISAAFRIFVKAPTNEIQADFLNIQQENFKQFRIFQLGGVGVLAVFFVALLANFVLFSNYSSKNQELNAQLIYQSTTLNKLDTLKKEYEQQKTFFNKNNLTQRSKTSFYADRIASTLPSDIQLTTLNIYPKIKKRRMEMEAALPEFEQNRIQVKGKTSSSIYYNDWKRSLNNLEWITDIYQIQYQEESGFGEFEVVLVIRE